MIKKLRKAQKIAHLNDLRLKSEVKELHKANQKLIDIKENQETLQKDLEYAFAEHRVSFVTNKALHDAFYQNLDGIEAHLQKLEQEKASSVELQHSLQAAIAKQHGKSKLHGKLISELKTDILNELDKQG